MGSGNSVRGAVLGWPWVSWGHTERAGPRAAGRGPQERDVLGEPRLWIEGVYSAVSP